MIDQRIHHRREPNVRQGSSECVGNNSIKEDPSPHSNMPNSKMPKSGTQLVLSQEVGHGRRTSFFGLGALKQRGEETR